MKDNFRNQKEITVGYLNAGIEKSHKGFKRLTVLGILAGMFIAFGASSSMVASHAIENYGVAKIVAGCVFPVGLMLIIMVGGELFTGDCLMVMGTWHKEYDKWVVTKKLTVIWVSNFIGALIMVLIVNLSGQLDISYGLLGAYTIKVAYGKVTLTFLQAFVSGIGCNIIVCAAMLMAYSATDTTGKLLGAFFPIMAFVVSGFEHCVANMYYICAGLLAMMNDSYKEMAMETYHLTAEQLEILNVQNLFMNLIPVTLGNIVGGMIFIGLPIYLLNIKFAK
ncbi:MAG: formate/nitrite transporter family protein [Eubacteriales bacterium]